jgi:glycosyltransferase involved in cell wall biosynthesis
MNKQENIQKLENSLSKLVSNEYTIYFLTYDTRNNARASVKHIYDMALTLKENGKNVKILVEDKTYTGVQGWLGDKYDSLEVVTIKDDRVEIKIEDVIVVPEYYSNVLENLANIKCVKVMLVQQKEYMFETLPIGSRWSDFGFDKVITTTESSKNYIEDYFKESMVYIIPPMIGENFKPSEVSAKPTIAISCRERSINKKIISEFYLKYPHLRWINFRDMNQMTYTEFSESLKECMVSVWVDDDSTFGTFPLESMKCGVPVIGKIPKNEPDWLGENGMWTYDETKITEILGKFVMAWLEGVELTDEVTQKMKDTLLPYDSEITKGNINVIFESFKTSRVLSIEKALEKLTKEEATV